MAFGIFNHYYVKQGSFMLSKSFNILLLLLISFSFNSCNFYKIKENQVNSKFAKAGLQSKYLKLNNTTIHYWIGGSDNPLILIHGFGADSRFQWYDQVGELSKKYRLIIPDLIYFNESKSSSNDFSIEFQADKIIELIQYLKINSFSIIGVSYGGLVAITICDKLPKKINKLVISDSPIKYYSLKHNEVALKKYNAQTIQELIIPQNPKDIPRLFELAYYNPPWVPSMVLNNIHENMFKNQIEEKGKLLDYLKNNEKLFADKKYEVNCKVLLIWGKYDLLIPTEIGYKLKNYLKDNATLEIIDKTAHAPNMENPKYFNKLVLDFLNQQ